VLHFGGLRGRVANPDRCRPAPRRRASPRAATAAAEPQIPGRGESPGGSRRSESDERRQAASARAPATPSLPSPGTRRSRRQDAASQIPTSPRTGSHRPAAAHPAPWGHAPRRACWPLSPCRHGCGGGASALPSGAVKACRGPGVIPNVPVRRSSTWPTRPAITATRASSRAPEKTDPELVTLVGQGAVDVGISDGNQRDPRRSARESPSATSHVFASPERRVLEGEQRDRHGPRTSRAGRWASRAVRVELDSSWRRCWPASRAHGIGLQLIPLPRFGQLARFSRRGGRRDRLPAKQRAGPAGAQWRQGERARPSAREPATRPGPDRERRRPERPEEGRPAGIRGATRARDARHRG